MLSHPGVIAANTLLALVWLAALLLADGDAGRAVASFLLAVHGSLAVVGIRAR